MYLRDDALRSTLAAVRERSSSGSTLLLHYLEPSVTSGDRRFRQTLFSLLGEPQIGLRSQAKIRQQLEDAGFLIEKDAGSVEQAALVRAEAPDNALARISRVCVARVTG
jgi:hypothetical protein